MSHNGRQRDGKYSIPYWRRQGFHGSS
jgi:hypothetical protein